MPKKKGKQIKTYLTKRGYVVIKSLCSFKEIHKCKKDLNVSPYVHQNFMQNVPSFPVYLESVRKMYLPRHYGIEHFGEPDDNKLNDGLNINLKFKGSMRPKQKKVIDAYLNTCKPNSTISSQSYGGIICVPCGFGKCFAKDTTIMMYSGKTKLVQNIKVGDLLMGDDSQPRVVERLGSGKEMMYTIVHDNDESYTVNKSHILSLIRKENDTYTPIDIPLTNYLELSLEEKQLLYGYKVPVEFKQQDLKKGAYNFGKQLAQKKQIGYTLNHYINSKQTYLSILAGYLDNKITKDTITLDKHYCFYDDRFDRLEFLTTICQYLGLELQYNNKLNILTISGHCLSEIPITNPEIQKSTILPAKHTYQLFTINVIPMNYDNYYGFEISGNNRRFLLANQIVVHNTVLALNLITQLKKKTLIVVHKEFLIEQWKERINQFIPFARIGMIRQKKADVENKDIVIAMLQSLSMKDYPVSIFDQFGFCICDECHHLGAQVFSRALPKIGCKYMLGLSATPKRSDGLTKVFTWYLGPIVYSINKPSNQQTVKVRLIEYNSDNTTYSKEELSFRGQLCTPRMINNICGYEKRTKFIINILQFLLSENRKILVLSDRRQHLQDLFNFLVEKQIDSVGFYVGGMKSLDRKKSESKDIILGTFNMASEGMDIPDLDTVILASPKSDIRQSIGRILRKQHTIITPLIIDLIDNFSCFSRQSEKRQRIYRKHEYLITKSIINDHNHSTQKDLLKMFHIEESVEYKKRGRRKNTDKKQSNKNIHKCLLLDDDDE